VDPNDEAFDILLTNRPLQFNCFMNSVIQVFWHCQPIRDALKELSALMREAERVRLDSKSQKLERSSQSFLAQVSKFREFRII
jgi:hypothetical protein